MQISVMLSHAMIKELWNIVFNVEQNCAKRHNMIGSSYHGGRHI